MMRGEGTAYYLYRPTANKYPPMWKEDGRVYRVDPPVRYRAPYDAPENETESRFVVGLPLIGGKRALIACDESGMYSAMEFLRPMNWQFDEAMLWENGYELLNDEDVG